LKLGVVAVHHLVHDAILGSKLLEQCIVSFNLLVEDLDFGFAVSQVGSVAVNL
jgi:hypothetical protein